MVPMWWQAIFITFNYSTFHRTHFPPTACFHPKITFSQLFHKGIKLWFSQKGIMTIGNCSRVTYDGSHAAASYFEHIPPHPLSTHSLFSPKNYIFSYLKNSKPFEHIPTPFHPFHPLSLFSPKNYIEIAENVIFGWKQAVGGKGLRWNVL